MNWFWCGVDGGVVCVCVCVCVWPGRGGGCRTALDFKDEELVVYDRSRQRQEYLVEFVVKGSKEGVVKEASAAVLPMRFVAEVRTHSHSPTHSLTHSPPNSPTRSLAHSLTHAIVEFSEYIDISIRGFVAPAIPRYIVPMRTYFGAREARVCVRGLAVGGKPPPRRY